MDEKEKFEANKKCNAPFLRALGVLMKEKNLNQAQAAELLNTKSGTFSDYKNGKKRASQEMYDRPARAFGGRLNVRYLTGESEYMMLENVPAEELAEYGMRDVNPDFDLMKREHQKPQQPAMSTFDTSMLIEKAVEKATAYADKTIAALEGQLAEKEKYIKLLEQKIEVLEAMQHIDAGEILISPFPVGVADSGETVSSEYVNTRT